MPKTSLFDLKKYQPKFVKLLSVSFAFSFFPETVILFNLCHVSSILRSFVLLLITASAFNSLPPTSVHYIIYCFTRAAFDWSGASVLWFRSMECCTHSDVVIESTKHPTSIFIYAIRRASACQSIFDYNLNNTNSLDEFGLPTRPIGFSTLHSIPKRVVFICCATCCH